MVEQILKGIETKSIFSNPMFELRDGYKEPQMTLFNSNALLFADATIISGDERNSGRALILSHRLDNYIPIHKLSIPRLLVPPYAHSGKTADFVTNSALEGSYGSFFIFVSPDDARLAENGLLMDTPYNYDPVVVDEEVQLKLDLGLAETDTPQIIKLSRDSERRWVRRGSYFPEARREFYGQLSLFEYP
jgi:hypothetical protein